MQARKGGKQIKEAHGDLASDNSIPHGLFGSQDMEWYQTLLWMMLGAE